MNDTTICHIKQGLILLICSAFAFMAGMGVGSHESRPTRPKPAYIVAAGHRVPIYPGAEVSMTIEGGQDAATAVILRDHRAKAKGADLSTSVDSFASNFQVSAPEIRLDGVSSTAGEAIYAAKGLAAKGHMVIIFAGVLCFVGGVVCAIYWSKKTGIYIAAAGVALILIGVLLERYPWVALLLPAVAAGVVVWWWWRTRDAARKDQTLQTVVAGVEAAPQEAAAAVKAAIASVASGGKISKIVKSTVTAIKDGGPAPAA